MKTSASATMVYLIWNPSWRINPWRTWSNRLGNNIGIDRNSPWPFQNSQNFLQPSELFESALPLANRRCSLIPRPLPSLLLPCIFISTPTVSKPLKHQKLYVIFFSDFSRLSRTTWPHQMIKCLRTVQKLINDAEYHAELVLASNKIIMLGDPEPSSGL